MPTLRSYPRQSYEFRERKKKGGTSFVNGPKNGWNKFNFELSQLFTKLFEIWKLDKKWQNEQPNPYLVKYQGRLVVLKTNIACVICIAKKQDVSTLIFIWMPYIPSYSTYIRSKMRWRKLIQEMLLKLTHTIIISFQLSYRNSTSTPHTL